MDSNKNETNPLNPCAEPICENGCVHGFCKSPNFCGCQVGWEGISCDVCISRPGCDHGYCNTEFECLCEDGWAGALCDKRKYIINFFRQSHLIFESEYFKTLFEEFWEN